MSTQQSDKKPQGSVRTKPGVRDEVVSEPMDQGKLRSAPSSNESQLEGQLREQSPQHPAFKVGPQNTKGGLVWALAQNKVGDLPDTSAEDAWARAQGEGGKAFINRESKPETVMNRAEAAKVAMLAKYGDAEAGARAAIHFHDAEGAWYSATAHAARAYGVIKGYEDNSFRPTQTIDVSEGQSLADQTAAASSSPVSTKQQTQKLFAGLQERAIAAGPGAPGVKGTYEPEEDVSPSANVKVPALHVVLEQIAHRIVYKSVGWLKDSADALDDRTLLWSAGYDLPDKPFESKPDGFFAMIFPVKRDAQKPAKRPVLAFRGSEDVKDFLIADMQVSVGSSQFKAAMNTELVRVAKLAGKCDVTGHSLGGALAQHMAVEHPSVCASVVTFQAPGIGAKAKGSGVDAEDVTHYVGAGDFVHLAGGDHIDGDVIQANGFAWDSALEANTVGAGVGHGDGVFESPEFAQTLDSVGQKDEALTGIDARVLTQLDQHPAESLKGKGLEILRLIVAGKTWVARVLLSELVFQAGQALDVALEVGGYMLDIAIEGGKKTVKLMVEGVEFVADVASDAMDAAAKAVDSMMDEVASLLEEIGEAVEEFGEVGSKYGKTGILLLP